jgi:hypothetical protein
MEQITLPDELDKSTVLPILKIAKRWDTLKEVAEGVLKNAGVELIQLPQRPRLGVRLRDLLDFEERLRADRAKEKAERDMQEAENGKRHAAARERMRHKQEEADRIVEEARTKEEAAK